MAFTWQPGTSAQTTFIDGDAIQIFATVSRPAAAVADWCLDPGWEVQTWGKAFTDAVARWLALEAKLADLALQDHPKRPDAVQRCEGWLQRAKAIALQVIEREHDANEAWQLLSSEQRQRFGCAGLWEIDPAAPELIGHWLQLRAYARLPDGFDLAVMLGWRYGVWGRPQSLGEQEWVRRGMLWGPPNWKKAQEREHRRAATIAAMKERRYG